MIKAPKDILKILPVTFLFAINCMVSAQTVTQIKEPNLTEQECKELISTAKSTLNKEGPNLCKYIDESQTPTITKYILHITVKENKALPSYDKFFGTKDGSTFYKVLLPCSTKTYKEKNFEYPYVAIIYIWDNSHRPFYIMCGYSGIFWKI
ncbi:MAG: hypothetical protein LKI39_14610 [Bacteroides sp.]|jgi:hypothetical protein|nr:hypothetical protein [Bacteroides sp.]